MDILPSRAAAFQIVAGATDQPDPKVAAISPPLYPTCASGDVNEARQRRICWRRWNRVMLGRLIRGQGRKNQKGKPMKFLRTATIAAALLGVSLGTGLAADPMGTWRTEEGKATVRIAACGPALCGTIISLKEANDDAGKPKTDKNNADSGLRNRPMIGVLVVLDMKPGGTANKWSGQVYNAEDGKTYSGNLTLQDANTIKLEGCIMGGLVCKAQTWTRAS
jgi:uncharacterized protein (DUF2147 family)